MTIVAATDFSSCSLTAVRLAAIMARRKSASLLLLTVVEPVAVDPLSAPLSEGWDGARLTAAEQALDEEASALRKTGLDVRTTVLLGAPAASVLEVAREERAELVVVGTHGRRGAARLFLGSCAEAVVRHAPCPVLVTGAEPTSLARWNETTPLRLTVVSDGSGACDAALAWTRSSNLSTPSDVSLVRVYWPPREAARYGLEEAWRDNEGDPALLALVERDLRKDARPLTGTHEPQIRFRVAGYDVGADVASDARLLDAEAIVIGVPAHHRGTFTGLRAASLLRAATVPVFCVPEGPKVRSARIPKVETVLVACDLSDASVAAVTACYGLLPGGGRVELVHVHERGVPTVVENVDPMPRLTDEERARVEARLRAAVPREAAEHGVATRIEVIEGMRAAEGILQAADRLAVDVIALGSHGRSGLARAVVGSVAEEIMRRSSRPVFVVRS
ncbi:MAG TPA: universal stress protein [Polyangia bacterium]|nr:universal stress protein [Polyangia bacterium]